LFKKYHLYWICHSFCRDNAKHEKPLCAKNEIDEKKQGIRLLPRYLRALKMTGSDFDL